MYYFGTNSKIRSVFAKLSDLIGLVHTALRSTAVKIVVSLMVTGKVTSRILFPYELNHPRFCRYDLWRSDLDTEEYPEIN